MITTEKAIASGDGVTPFCARCGKREDIVASIPGRAVICGSCWEADWAFATLLNRIMDTPGEIVVIRRDLVAEVGERGVSPVTGEPYILLTFRDGCTHAVCRLPWDRIRPATRDEISRYRERRSKG